MILVAEMKCQYHDSFTHPFYERYFLFSKADWSTNEISFEIPKNIADQDVSYIYKEKKTKENRTELLWICTSPSHLHPQDSAHNLTQDVYRLYIHFAYLSTNAKLKRKVFSVIFSLYLIVEIHSFTIFLVKVSE